MSMTILATVQTPNGPSSRAIVPRYCPALSSMPVDARQTTHVLRRMLDEPRAPGCMWRYLPSNFPP